MAVAADYVDRCPGVNRTLPTSTFCTGIPSIHLLNALAQNNIMATLTPTNFYRFEVFCIGFCLEKLIHYSCLIPFSFDFGFFYIILVYFWIHKSLWCSTKSIELEKFSFIYIKYIVFWSVQNNDKIGGCILTSLSWAYGRIELLRVNIANPTWLAGGRGLYRLVNYHLVY